MEDDSGFEEEDVEVRLRGRVVLVRVVDEAVAVTEGFGVLADAVGEARSVPKTKGIERRKRTSTERETIEVRRRWRE